MTAPTTPFAKWRARMGALEGLRRPIFKKEAAERLGLTDDTATALDKADRIDIRTALACAALEHDLKPIA